ncbi:bifunctional 3'-5' exonuclease/ATP-dependent helicase WRN-like [Crassostrea virginica]
MEDQVQRIQKTHFVSAEYIGSNSDFDVKARSVDVILASPELLVGNKTCRDNIQSLNVKVIVIDEFHTIATWGAVDKKEEEAFRRWFRHIGELRSLFPAAAMLALSATCTQKMLKKILKVLNMTECPNFVSVSPNKQNIKYVFKKIEHNIESSMLWLVEGLLKYKEKFPRTLVYCKSIKDVSHIYNYIISEVPDLSRHIEMFHSETTNETKLAVIHQLTQKDDLMLRVVVATSALGMGIDVEECHSVVLYGPPPTLVDLLQECGRIGRDGKDSVAVILHHSYHYQNLDEEVKTVLKSSKCRRMAIMTNFVSTTELNEIGSSDKAKHSCCDFCEKCCNCGNCRQFKLVLEKCVEEDIEEIDFDSDPSDGESDDTVLYYESDFLESAE